MQIRLSRRTARDLNQVAKKLRGHGDGKALRKKTIAALKKAVKPVERNVKTASKNLPATGRKSSGLRKRMAAATGNQVRLTGKNAGIRIKVAKARLGAQGPLPRLTNKGRWRHPVFGNRERWVEQTSRQGWFDEENRRGAPTVRREIEKVLSDIEKELDQ